MDDLRFSNKKKIRNRRRFVDFISFIKKKWIKILLFLLLIFIIIFPDITGEIIGNWWNVLVNSFLKNLTY